MKSFIYEKADTPEAAVRGAGAARFIAGGTNLLDLMKLQVETPAKLVDISRLDLASIDDGDDGGLTIGALMPNSDLAADPRIIARYEVLSRALLAGASGSSATRHRLAATCCSGHVATISTTLPRVATSDYLEAAAMRSVV